MIINNSNKKVQIEYPCRWLYKVIGADHDAMRQAIEEIVQVEKCTITLSNASSKGKYLCLNVEVMVFDEEARNNFYVKLKAHQAVKTVL
jgi:hypothetical protein